MTESIFLAKFFGIYLIVVSLALLVKRKNIDLIYSLYKTKEAILATGAIDVALGTALVLTQYVWEWGWQGVITLIGWLLLVRGVVRLIFPEEVLGILTNIQEVTKKNTGLTTLLLVIVFVIGIYFSYTGFTQ